MSGGLVMPAPPSWEVVPPRWCKSGWSLTSGYPCCAANSQLALTSNSDCAWRAAIQRSGGIAESDPALTRL